MIRRETLTTYKNWVKPTADEVQEMYAKCSDSMDELSSQIGVTTATLRRWIKVGISYSDWALLAFLAGRGDIVRPEETEQEVEAKLENLAKVSFIYHKRLNDVQQMNAIKKKLSKK